jgi:hypothetical protein
MRVLLAPPLDRKERGGNGEAVLGAVIDLNQQHLAISHKPPQALCENLSGYAGYSLQTPGWLWQKKANHVPQGP